MLGRGSDTDIADAQDVVESMANFGGRGWWRDP